MTHSEKLGDGVISSLLFTFERDGSQVLEKHLGYKTGKKLILLFKRFTSHRCKEKIYKLSKENALKRGGGSLSLFFHQRKLVFSFSFCICPYSLLR